MRARPRVAFAGTPEFAVPSLAAVAAAADVPIVLTQPDRPAGRGRRLTAPPVKAAAERLGLAVAQPVTLRDTDVPARFGPRPDLLVVVAYGLLLPRSMLEWPVHGCVNVHASLLPRWRGAAPIQHAILAGDAETGVSLMRLDAGLDTGPVYARRATAIGARETASELSARLAGLGAAALAEALPAIVAGGLAAVPQVAAEATHAPKIAKADARLDWTENAAALARRVRAFNPWPVATVVRDDGVVLRVWRAEPVAAAPEGAAPGSVLAANATGIDVATGTGVLRIAELQPPGGRAMPAAAYVAAHDLTGRRFV